MKRKLALTLILTLFMTGCGETATVTDAESTTATESESTEETTEELASAMAQADLTATPSPAPTASPIPTATPVPEPATRIISPDYSVTDLDATMYAKSTVNVRSLPDTVGDKVGSLTKDQEVTVTGKCNETGWYEIAYADGTAYVSDAYLVSEKVTTTAAVATGNTGSSRQSTGSNGNYAVPKDVFNRISEKIELQWFNDPGWNPSEVCNEECSVKGMTYGEINDLFIAGKLLDNETAINMGLMPSTGSTPTANTGTAVASSSSSSASSSSEAGFMRDQAEQIFALLNADRVAAGLNELVWDESLYDIAVQRCYENDIHEGMREGTTENAYRGSFGGAQSIHSSWHNSQGHYDNYMNSSHEKGAVAVYNTGSGVVAYEVFQTAATEWVDRNTGEVNTAPVTVTSGTLTWYHECDQGWDAMCPLCNPEGWREAQEAYYAQ